MCMYAISEWHKHFRNAYILGAQEMAAVHRIAKLAVTQSKFKKIDEKLHRKNE